MDSTGKDVTKINVTGAGDTMVGTSAWWLNHEPSADLVQVVYGGTISAAAAVLEVDAAVNTHTHGLYT
jgi:fructose-1-phosphate kinase PfkB-like protein